jgi:cysteine protease ATG4
MIRTGQMMLSEALK